MTRSLSAGLRGRVIAADVGVSARKAARRFRIGISTAKSWYRPSLYHRGRADITLAEIGERLAAERGVRVALSTVWLFLDRRGWTF
ncbi:hypothetical protein NKH28_15425 [Mesorhizobium sp. M1227]|uniref:hypothetical protein n=1 Tax=Mesorhizobium sp. M1227 TaxID=2957071 RepID=UPI00333CB323